MNIDREYTGSLLFHLSRLGKDSVYSSIVNINIPARQQSKVRIVETPAVFSIVPNPCVDRLTVTFEKNVKEPMTFTVYDMLGRRMMEERVVSAKASSVTIPLPLLPDGSYVLVGSDQQRQRFAKRFVMLNR